MTYDIDQITDLLRRAQSEGVPIQPVAEYVLDGIRSKKAESIQAQNDKAPFETGFPGGGPYGNSVIFMLAGRYEKEVPDWSYYPFQRDLKLRQIWKEEPTMASAIYSITSRIQSLSYEITGEFGHSKQLMKSYERIIRDSQFGQGFYVLRQKMANDLLTQDNGVFVEIVGAGNPKGPLKGIPVQINHIDSLLAWRTFDPEYPVIYTDPYTNKYHKLHYTRVAYASSMTSPDEMARNIGFCAVSRALRNVQYLRDVMVYKHEKVSGRFTRAIGWGRGFTDKQMQEGLEGVEQERKTRGFAIYKGIPFVMSAREGAELNMLDLAKLPDGFDFEKEMNLLVYSYAMAFGVDAREFWPSTMAGATKADASVQHLKARGKGYADVITNFESMINNRIFDPERGIRIKFDQTDDEADLLMSRIHGQEITNLDALVKMGSIDNEEARAIAIAKGLLNRQHLKENPDLMSPARMFQAKLDAQAKMDNEKPEAGDKKPDIQDHTGSRNTFDPKRKKDEKSFSENLLEPTEEELDAAYTLYRRILSGD